MNLILDEIIKERNGHYCHCVEVSEVYELESLAETIIEEYSVEYLGKYTEQDIINFLESLEVYCIVEANEEEVFNFSFTEYIKGTI